jgi:hypothetical protein
VSFLAKYRGTCSDCEQTIHPDDEVQYDEARELVHVECQQLERKPAPVCPTCWLEKPCECEES